MSVIHPVKTAQSAARSGSGCCILFAAPALLVSAAERVGAQITYLSLTGSWHDPTDNVPGSQPGDPVITNGNPTSIIRWGTTSGTPQSGYDFTAATPCRRLSFPGPRRSFLSGRFASELRGRRSFADFGAARRLPRDQCRWRPLPSSDLHLYVQPRRDPEQPNPCPYPTPPGDGCSDRVSIVASPTPTTFNVDGVDYTLGLSFLDQRQSGVRVHYERRRHHQHHGPGRGNSRRRRYAGDHGRRSRARRR